MSVVFAFLTSEHESGVYVFTEKVHAMEKESEIQTANEVKVSSRI